MPGYGLPTSRRGLLPWRWALQRLTRSHNYWVTTTRPGGAPHVMPVWGIWRGNRFYFSTGRQSRKARNLTADARCVVCSERAQEAVIVEGVAAEVRDIALVKRLAGPYHRKYRPWTLDPSLGPVYAVTPRVVFGIAEARFPAAATRWVFEA
jgi:nitroimidazol reductase NimA-like FMN-containing flavoprotein (pyridoxamine 5'-phosphate oxidase superfamily)